MTTAVESAPTGAQRTAPQAAPLETAFAEHLATEYRTPLYVYDFDVIDRQLAALEAILPRRFELAYAVKANPALGVVAHLASRGIGADVASGGELATALRAGVHPGRIVFTGPGKREDELEVAVRAGIRAITVESRGELARLEAIAAGLDQRVPILLRVATASPTSDAGSVAISTEGGGKFGIDRSDLPDAARQAAASAHLDLLGIHAFGASNVRDADRLADHIEETVSLAIQTARDLRRLGPGFDLRVVDVGGGLGIPYRPGDTPLDTHLLGRRLNELMTEWTRTGVALDAILVEPGRFLVGPAGTYLTRVLDRKRVGGSDVVVVDGGIHHLVRPALVGTPHAIVNLTGSRGRASSAVTVAGPLCSGLDVLASHVRIPSPEPGDLLAVLDTGAYGFTESMPLFLSHPTPAEVAISGGRTALLRPRLEPDTWLASQQLPGW